MASKPKVAVIAVGGNSLISDSQHQSIPDQSHAAEITSHHIADLVASGWRVVVTHGSGPQVGFILRRSELAMDEVPPVPMDYAGADLQGAIGYMFQRALHNEFHKREIEKRAIAVVTQVLVDRADPAFDSPVDVVVEKWEIKAKLKVDATDVVFVRFKERLRHVAVFEGIQLRFKTKGKGDGGFFESIALE